MQILQRSSWVLTVSLLVAALSACASDEPDETVLIANRGSSSFSVISVKDDDVQTHDLPTGSAPPEPMYIVFSPKNNLVYIGDRANNRLVVYHANDYSTPTQFVPVGAGIFHMWGDQNRNQLWVNNDIDKTISVVNMLTSSVISTIAVPADLASGKPHDVILDPNAPFAYVTILGVSGSTDYVLKYSTDSFTELGRIEVGNDPHVVLSGKNDTLYVPTQGGGKVYVVNRTSFEIIGSIDIPNSHGAGMASDGKTLFTTNIAAGGAKGLISIDTQSNAINSSVDTPASVPHNIVLSPDQQRLFLTHSGPSNNTVSVWDVSDLRKPVYLKSLTAGTNPYGIAVVAPR